MGRRKKKAALPEIFVDLNAKPPGRGTRAEPFVRLQDAADLATNEATIFVALGDYRSQGEVHFPWPPPTLSTWEK